MPTYEYQCEKCKKSFECFQPMTEAPLKVCTKALCRRKTWGKGKVKRQVGTGAGLLFKGSGFYITDYRSEGYKASAKTESGGGESKAAESKTAEPKTTDTKKAETKPAASETKKPAAKKKGE